MTLRQAIGFLIAMFLTLLSVASSADTLKPQMKWETPWKLTGYDFDRFKAESSDNAFSIVITKSDGDLFYGIQIFTRNRIELEPESRYRIVFAVRADQSFKLYSRLGDHAIETGQAYKDRWFAIIGDGEWHADSLDFTAIQKRNYLYFQLGDALAHTHFSVRDIHFRQIADTDE